MSEDHFIELLTALRDFIEDAPRGDNDMPYCSDVMQPEFKRLCLAWENYLGLYEDPATPSDAEMEIGDGSQRLP